MNSCSAVLWYVCDSTFLAATFQRCHVLRSHRVRHDAGIMPLTACPESVDGTRGQSTRGVSGGPNVHACLGFPTLALCLIGSWQHARRRGRRFTTQRPSLRSPPFFENLNKALQKGRRPTVPSDVLAEHATFIAIMARCWAGDPVDRPTCSEAISDLAAQLRA